MSTSTHVIVLLTEALLPIPVTNLLFYICAEKIMKKYKRILLTTFEGYYIMHKI